MTVDAPGRNARRSAQRTVEIERQAVAALADMLDGEDLGAALEGAVALIAQCLGRLIVTGVGKSGIVARKIVATMNSTGTPAAFLHAAEAGHGDLGMITSRDIVLMLSWSGESQEAISIIDHGRRSGVPLVAMTAEPASTVALAADIVLVLPRINEACPNRMAPTSSTTVQMVLGDALAIALIEARGFSSNDFLRLHPNGSLGLHSMTVRKLMGIGDAIPRIGPDATIIDATVEMSRKRYGSTAIVDAHGRILGAFTDGDLRRSFAHAPDSPIVDHMNRHPITVAPGLLASKALSLMNDNAITMLFVCETDNLLIGALHLHDIVRIGYA